MDGGRAGGTDGGKVKGGPLQEDGRSLLLFPVVPILPMQEAAVAAERAIFGHVPSGSPAATARPQMQMYDVRGTGWRAR